MSTANALIGQPSLYSVNGFDSPLQVSLSPQGHFFCVLTPTSVSLWTADAQHVLVGLTIHAKRGPNKDGSNKEVVWSKDGGWIAILVCHYLLFFDYKHYRSCMLISFSVCFRLMEGMLINSKLLKETKPKKTRPTPVRTQIPRLRIFHFV